MKNKRIDETLHWRSSGRLVQKEERAGFPDEGYIEGCVDVMPLETGFEKYKTKMRNEVME
mgnify:CR=1 FL=1